MTYTIAEPCIGEKDRSCIDVCPVDCIHDDVHLDGVSEEESKDRILYIDPDECIDCGACEPACPFTAIFAEDDVPDQWKEYTAINALWYKDRDAARAKVAAIAPK
jgi:NAD-dependent dihydropyrimidine dehydrogenase PreA subunit